MCVCVCVGRSSGATYIYMGRKARAGELDPKGTNLAFACSQCLRAVTLGLGGVSTSRREGLVLYTSVPLFHTTFNKEKKKRKSKDNGPNLCLLLLQGTSCRAIFLRFFLGGYYDGLFTCGSIEKV